jgi:hypothetical protein
MACPNSPEGGYHRFPLASNGLEFETRCTYCGAEKTLRPFTDEADNWGTPSQRRARAKALRHEPS